MCLICLELERAKMSVPEARRALGEMRESLDPDHRAEVEAKIAEAEQDSTPPDPQRGSTP